MQSPSGGIALQVRNLRKAYKDVVAVDGLDLEVFAGECFGLLGPNGAGKTTTIEICEGLLAPDTGEVMLLGHTWQHDRAELCERLGVQLQETQFAEKLTVYETVRLFRSFYAAGRSPDEVVSLVQLDEKRNARVGKLSGGQKQRLALACSIIGNPDLLFLDEPTTGLDVQSRTALWEEVERLAKEDGVTVFLTTQYLEEADVLSDRIAIIDKGKIVAEGTPGALKSQIGRPTVEARPADPLDRERVASALGRFGEPVPCSDDGVAVRLRSDETGLADLVRALDAEGLKIENLQLHQPSLDDVFLAKTGRSLEGASQEEPEEEEGDAAEAA